MIPEFIANWHSHTFRCKHAAGDIKDYCEQAVKAGLKVIGVSDHGPTKDGRWSGVRMDYSLMPDYIAAFEKAAGFTSLKIYKGLECEWVPAFGKSYYTDELRGKFGLDFIAAAPHSFTMETGSDHWYNSFLRSDSIDQKAWLRGYGRYVLEVIETGLFDYLAHPDLIGCFCTAWTPDAKAVSRDIAQAARDAHTLLEINSSGIRKPGVTDSSGETRAQYPWRPFWETAAEEGAKAIINTDAHSPELIDATVDECFALAKSVGIEVRIPLTPAEMRL